MALNTQILRTRTLSAIVFMAVMFCGLFINKWSYLILFSVIYFGCIIEYQQLLNKIKSPYKNFSFLYKSAIALTGFGFILFMANPTYSINTITISTIGLYILIAAFLILLLSVFFTKNIHVKPFIFSLAGLLYIAFSCGCMIDLRSEGIISDNYFAFDSGLILPLLLIFSIWINDTMAYIVGSLIGKTPFSPISPKKTWEGTIGGALLAITTITICGFIFFNADVIQLVIVSAIASVAGVSGDLLESKFKRMANVKDSGKLMPGHGGFLDRFDSLLLAAIFVWLYVKLFL